MKKREAELQELYLLAILSVGFVLCLITLGVNL